jgi:hypothetical protein
MQPMSAASALSPPLGAASRIDFLIPPPWDDESG